ncbi:unnamed protein product [Parnassius apollo]|uniref:(apollo) hypothetical protein n=1 Tax=Parnassius apollo TaxID=110799 RepID=A0A8S3XQD6_PARAO|nr:unnamed protein product [Parnassius apollo]
MDLPVVGDSDDDEMVSHGLAQMRSILEEAILETRSMPLENRPRLPRIPLSKRNRAVVRALNPMLVTYFEASRDLCETDSVLFGAAVAACRIIGAKLPMAGRATKQSSAIPTWRKRIEDRIAKVRALIRRLISFRSGNNRPRVVRTVRMAFAGTNISLSQPDITQKLTERIDDLKQKIASWGKRIRRFTERSRRFNQNRLFQSDQKRLYKSLERPEVCGAGPGPDQANTVAFWRGLWSEPVNHSEGPWTEVVASQCASITPMDPVIITPDDVAEAVRRAPNWKCPGLDGLHHYWLKGFMVCHAVLARQFQEALNQKSLPSLFTTGITHLVPKDQAQPSSQKFQPDITQKLTERIDDLKQKIAAWGKRIRRFSERSRRFNQNRLFQSDQKRLYKSLERPEVCGAGPGPDQADTVAFWRGLWSEPVNHSEGPWMEVVASQSASVTPMDPVTIRTEDVAEAVRRAPNWKCPGLDGLHHYWLKGFVVCHAVLARQFQEALDQIPPHHVSTHYI